MSVKTPLILFLLLLLLSTACRLGAGVAESSRPAPDLRKQALQLINCLNRYDFDCVGRLYAADYQSWEPPLEITDKTAFIQKMSSNYQGNQLRVEAKILEVRQREGMGCVWLDWQLLSLKEEGEPRQLLHKKAVQLWEPHRDGHWMLRRSLFYDF